MKRLIVSLDEDTANLLDKKVNKADTVRKALRLYHGDITTDSIEGLRASYTLLTKELKEQRELLQQLYELVEASTSQHTSPWHD